MVWNGMRLFLNGIREIVDIIKKMIPMVFSSLTKISKYREYRVVCSGEDEMNHLMDRLIDRGYHAQTEVTVLPVPGVCVFSYAVVYWE